MITFCFLFKFSFFFVCFQAYCDMEIDGGGWTVIQKRFNGIVDFHQTWKNYTMVRILLRLHFSLDISDSFTLI